MTTTSPTGRVYKGTRFCILIGGETVCGTTKITEWKRRPTTPVCLRCVECAAEIRAGWRVRWPESKPYFRHISEVVDGGGAAKNFGSGVVRGGMIYTQAANNYFSSLAAYGAKMAFYNVQRACWTARPGDLLYGSRAIAFVHDEALTEHPEDLASEAAPEVARIMRETMQAVVPDIKIKAEAALMRKLYKGAEPVYDGDKLIPWEPSE